MCALEYLCRKWCLVLNTTQKEGKATTIYAATVITFLVLKETSIRHLYLLSLVLLFPLLLLLLVLVRFALDLVREVHLEVRMGARRSEPQISVSSKDGIYWPACSIVGHGLPWCVPLYWWIDKLNNDISGSGFGHRMNSICKKSGKILSWHRIHDLSLGWNRKATTWPCAADANRATKRAGTSPLNSRGFFTVKIFWQKKKTPTKYSDVCWRGSTVTKKVPPPRACLT